MTDFKYSAYFWHFIFWIFRSVIFILTSFLKFDFKSDPKSKLICIFIFNDSFSRFCEVVLMLFVVFVFLYRPLKLLFSWYWFVDFFNYFLFCFLNDSFLYVFGFDSPFNLFSDLEFFNLDFSFIFYSLSFFFLFGSSTGLNFFIVTSAALLSIFSRTATC